MRRKAPRYKGRTIAAPEMPEAGYLGEEGWGRVASPFVWRARLPHEMEHTLASRLAPNRDRLADSKAPAKAALMPLRTERIETEWDAFTQQLGRKA